MKTLLHELYRGRVRPGEECWPGSEEYQTKQRLVMERQRAFLEHIGEKEREECLSVLEEITALSAMELEEGYIQGMRMGARLALALLDAG